MNEDKIAACGKSSRVPRTFAECLDKIPFPAGFTFDDAVSGDTTIPASEAAR
jgi:hypothetical protein